MREIVGVTVFVMDGRFFRSTDHIQRYMGSVPFADGYVPITYNLPHRLRGSDRLIETVADVLDVYCSHLVEIPNPEPKFQPV